MFVSLVFRSCRSLQCASIGEFTNSVDEKLQGLAPKVCTHNNAYPGDVAAGSRNVRYDPIDDRIAGPAHDWNCASFDLKREHNGVPNCKDDIGSCGDDLAGKLWKTLRRPLGGVPVHGEIYTLDIAETFDLFEDDCVVGVTPDAQVLRLGRRMNYGEALHLRRLLSTCNERRCSRAPDECDELAPLHSITSSARSSRDGGSVRPVACAAFTLAM